MRVGLFDIIDPPTPACVDMVRTVVDACDYPWHRLLPAMRVRNMPAIPVRWVDLPANENGRWDGTVKIAASLAGDGIMSRFVCAHEIGHCVEEWTLTGPTRQALGVALHGRTTPVLNHDVDTWGPTNDHYGSLREAAADLFAAVFAPAMYPFDPVAGNIGHWPSDVEATRSIWLADVIQPFTDIPPTSQLFEATALLADIGITTGKTDGRFDPDADCTRGQMALFLHRMYRALR